MAELQTIIRSAAAELGDKVAELQRQEKLVRDLQAQQVTTARDQAYKRWLTVLYCSLLVKGTIIFSDNHPNFRQGQLV